MSWRAATLAREAWLNLWSNPARTLLLLGLAGGAFGVVAFLELRQAEDIRAFVADYEAAGGYVAVLAPGQGATLEAARCEALNLQEGVIAAGPVRLTGIQSFSSAPGVLFQSAAVTQQTLATWAPGFAVSPAEGRWLVAGIALADELGLRPGSYLARPGEEPMLVAAVIDSSRNPQVQRWALDVAAPAGAADECWVAFRRESYEPGLESLPAWFATGSAEPVVRPYLRSDQFTRDPTREFKDRPQRFGWLAAGGLVVALAVLAAWFRRSELGLYLAVGTSRWQLFRLLALETAVVVVVAWAAALLWALALHRALHHPLTSDEIWLAVRSSGSGALLALVCAPVAASLVARGNIAALLKER